VLDCKVNGHQYYQYIERLFIKYVTKIAIDLHHHRCITVKYESFCFHFLPATSPPPTNRKVNGHPKPFINISRDCLLKISKCVCVLRLTKMLPDLMCCFVCFLRVFPKGFREHFGWSLFVFHHKLLLYCSFVVKMFVGNS